MSSHVNLFFGYDLSGKYSLLITNSQVNYSLVTKLSNELFQDERLRPSWSTASFIKFTHTKWMSAFPVSHRLWHATGCHSANHQIHSFVSRSVYWSLLYSAILHSRADPWCLHVILQEWVAFYSVFLNIHRSGVLTALALKPFRQVGSRKVQKDCNTLYKLQHCCNMIQ